MEGKELAAAMLAVYGDKWNLGKQKPNKTTKKKKRKKSKKTHRN